MQKYSRFVQLLILLFLLYCLIVSTEASSSLKRFQKIQNSINATISPCDNFYNYACGNWSETINGPSLEGLELIDLVTNTKMQKILESANFGTDSQFLGNVLSYYESCRNVPHTPSDATEYLKWLSDQENLNWPLALWNAEGDWNWDCDWIELLAVTRRYGFNELFFRQLITQRLDDPFETIIEFKRPNLKAMENLWGVLLKQNISTFKEIFENLSVFNQELLEGTSELFPIQEDEEAESYSDYESELVNLKDLQMPWLEKYLCVLLNLTDVDPDMQLYVQSVDYMKSVFALLTEYDNSRLCDYIHLHFYVFLTQQDAFRQGNACLESTRLQFPLVMQWLYGERYPEEKRELSLVQEMFGNLKEQFNKTLQLNTYGFREDIMHYLDDKLERLELITTNEISREALEKYYQPLTLNASEYHGNILRLNHFKFKVIHDTITKPVNDSKALEYLDISSWAIEDKPQAARLHLPLLYPRFNYIFLPWTILQYPYYDLDLQDMYTYSSLGFYLARVIVKAFDMQNLEIGADGIYDYDMADEMFDYYKFDGTSRRLKADFGITHEMDEVIADLGGLKLAYETFVSKHSDILHQEVVIQQHSMIVKQVFFLSYAHNFCSSNCTASAMNIGRYSACQRVNIPVTRFGKSRFGFQCKKNRKWGYPLWR